ncbi:MAG: hypothetical protein JEY99_11655 [Spirochaetales bacterium]|nr:hypothetical protein [Spirochaetales bacterium]
MDNDNKIVPKKSTTSLFLDDLNIEAVSEKDEYILKDEFAASKKNKNYSIVLILVALTLALGAGAWGITRWIEARNVIKDYELDEFQDVDLMDVLNQVRKIEIALAEAERQLVMLRREYQNALQVVIDTAEQEIYILESRDLDQEAVDGRLAEIAVKKAEGLQAVDDQYLERIAILEEQIAVLREQMSAYDAEKVQQAQEYESVIANEKQAFEIEKQKLIDSYETQLSDQEEIFNERLAELSGFQNDLESALLDTSEGRQSRIFMLYNPIITEDMDALFQLTNAPVNEERFAYNMVGSSAQWIERGYISSRDIRFLQEDVSEWRDLMGYLKRIPYENSVPDVLEQLEYRYLNLIDVVSQSTVSLFQALYSVENSLADTSQILSETESSVDELQSVLNRTESALEDVKADLRARNRQYNALEDSLEEMEDELTFIKSSFDNYEKFYELLKDSLTIRLRDSGGQGFLLEVGENGDFIAFMDPFLEIPGGVAGYIFGTDNEYIGQISLEKDEIFYRGIVLQKEEDRQFSAFDRIFLRINSPVEEGSGE